MSVHTHTRLFTELACIHLGCFCSTRPGGQDSVLRLLLGIDAIQMNVVDCILERVASLMEEEVELVLFVIEQLKWLDALVNGEVGGFLLEGS